MVDGAGAPVSRRRGAAVVRRTQGFYCSDCGALYSKPGSGRITCGRCGASGLRMFRKIPKRVRCDVESCRFEGWDDGGVNDDLGQHRRRAHAEVARA